MLQGRVGITNRVEPNAAISCSYASTCGICADAQFIARCCARPRHIHKPERALTPQEARERTREPGLKYRPARLGLTSGPGGIGKQHQSCRAPSALGLQLDTRCGRAHCTQRLGRSVPGFPAINLCSLRSASVPRVQVGGRGASRPHLWKAARAPTVRVRVCVVREVPRGKGRVPPPRAIGPVVPRAAPAAHRGGGAGAVPPRAAQAVLDVGGLVRQGACALGRDGGGEVGQP